MKLRVYNLYWLPHMAEQHDLCAHGSVEVQIGAESLDENSDDVCASAAALFLLRTLTRDHTPIAPIGDQLLPHCGHTMYKLVGKQEVEIHNCSSGVDWEVHHLATTIRLRTVRGTEEYLSLEQWQQVVFNFADTVAAFYAQSLPKEPLHAYEIDAYAAFQADWEQYRGKAFLNA